MGKLGEGVENEGVRVGKRGDRKIVRIGLVCRDGWMDKEDIGDYVGSNIEEGLRGVNGVGDMDGYGWEYWMGMWVEGGKVKSLEMRGKDVSDGIE